LCGRSKRIGVNAAQVRNYVQCVRIPVPQHSLHSCFDLELTSIQVRSLASYVQDCFFGYDMLVTNTASCEFRCSGNNTSDAIKRQGVPSDVVGCSRSGHNVDGVCDFITITDSNKCPHILFKKGLIDGGEFRKRLWGG
jgi:hypothetical protein